ncbi:hypothetical protein M8542_32260 [Amycolatopsis sp. OK19-0408]|uniref:Uncharacterized protein n=1 Tax=Amycolatopsis iheyensis TaxID=2945988 RepID=A0A9X2SNW1_9PSEU|nr:hypothetical protein [Amycolatopsis iheyensis]MCR6487511.1 hypothetical protein [Amycolatopsis iheyensis]
MQSETPDLVRLLRHFAARVLALAGFSALVGFTTVALALAVAGFAMLFFRVRESSGE